jgi:hypothetical protein
MPRTATANRVVQDDHRATLTRRGHKTTYDCDCGQTFTGVESSASDRWSKHVLAARAVPR